MPYLEIIRLEKWQKFGVSDIFVIGHYIFPPYIYVEGDTELKISAACAKFKTTTQICLSKYSSFIF